MNTVTIGLEEFDALRKQKQKHLDFIAKLEDSGKAIYYGSHGEMYYAYNTIEDANMAKEINRLNNEVDHYKTVEASINKTLKYKEGDFNELKKELKLSKRNNKFLIFSSLVLIVNVIYFLIY